MFTFHRFKSRGIGLVATQNIKQGTFLGDYYSKIINVTSNTRHVYNGWIETYPLGRFLNHNPSCNLELVLKKNRVELFTAEDILENTELTVNYLSAANLINLPEHLRIDYHFQDFQFLEETLNFSKNLI